MSLNNTFRVIELPFYEGERIELVIDWLLHYRFAFVPVDKVYEFLNAKSAVYLLKCLRNLKTGYQGYMIDGLSFKRQVEITDKKRCLSKDVDLYLDLRDGQGNIKMDIEGYRNSGSPHCGYFGIPDDRGNKILCTVVIFETSEAREKCYSLRHPDICLEMISRTYFL